jgi:hypothetical protein
MRLSAGCTNVNNGATKESASGQAVINKNAWLLLICVTMLIAMLLLLWM